MMGCALGMQMKVLSAKNFKFHENPCTEALFWLKNVLIQYRAT